jgi:tetratricopeptide (TPR) repeat protein
MGTSRLVGLAPAFICAAAWAHEAASPAACQAASERPAIARARAALEGNASDLRARFTLADAWRNAGCFSEALQVLQAGEALNPRNAELQARLREAKSVLSEQSYFEDLDRAAQDAKLSRAVFRCSKLAELSSCDEAVNMKPDDSALLIAQADTMVQLKRPGEAIGVYRRAATIAPGIEAVNVKIAAAESERRMLLDTCETKEGEVARRACESAWLPGSPDEEMLFKRRGMLLQADNRPSAALDAYMAAGRLNPGDPSVALAIVSLSDSTGRQDALTLASRGSALLALGRASEAVVPLRQALRLAPDLAGAKAQLQLAERAQGRERGVSAEKDRPVASHAQETGSASAKSMVASANSGGQGMALYSNTAPVTRSN